MEKQDSSDQVVSTLRQIIRAIDLHSKKLTKTYGLTGPQLLVLKEIQKKPQSPISEISRSVSLSQATVTSILDRLEQQGFAQRIRSQEDKRMVTVQLSNKALDVLKSNPSMLQEQFSQLFNGLNDWEQNMILSSLQRLVNLLNAEDIKSPPVLVSGPITASFQDVHRYLGEDELKVK